MGLFEQDTRIEKIADNQWQSTFTPRWCVGPVPNGGYVMAIAAKVLSAALPHKDPLSLNAFYFAPTQVGPVRCDVEALRSGGSTSFAVVRLYQQDELKVQVTAAFTDLDRVKGESQVSVTPTAIPDFEGCTRLPQNDFIQMTKYTCQKVAPGQELSMLGEPQKSGEWQGWIDFDDDNDVDVYALIFFSDAFPPPAFTYYGPVGWVPTLELSVQVRAKPVSGPIRCQFTSKMMTEGVVEEDGVLWDSAGNLVAISRQTAKFRLPK